MADDLIARCRRLLAQSDGPPVAIAQMDLAALIALAEPELQRIALSPRAAHAIDASVTPRSTW